jgi:hypothetical protein
LLFYLCTQTTANAFQSRYKSHHPQTQLFHLCTLHKPWSFLGVQRRAVVLCRGCN